MLGPIFLSLLAASLFAASHVTARRGLVESSAVAAVLLSCSSALLLLSIFVLFDPPSHLNGKGLALFASSGVAAPGVSRWAASIGVQRLGPSVAIPITQGARPLLAVTGAIFLLGERITILRLIGILFIIAGGWELSRTRGDARSPTMGSLEGPFQTGVYSRFFRVGIVFPILASVAYAGQDLLVKEGLSHLASPQFGAMVGMATALTLWVLGVLLIPRLRAQLVIGRDFGWLCLSGSLAAAAILSLFNALKLGDVSLVSPVAASQPLMVFLFSRMLLRDLEDLQAVIVLAGCAVVVGTILVSL